MMTISGTLDDKRLSVYEWMLKVKQWCKAHKPPKKKAGK
jgi:hypothetical protein